MRGPWSSKPEVVLLLVLQNGMWGLGVYGELEDELEGVTWGMRA